MITSLDLTAIIRRIAPAVAALGMVMPMGFAGAAGEKSLQKVFPRIPAMEIRANTGHIDLRVGPPDQLVVRLTAPDAEILDQALELKDGVLKLTEPPVQGQVMSRQEGQVSDPTLLDGPITGRSGVIQLGGIDMDSGAMVAPRIWRITHPPGLALRLVRLSGNLSGERLEKANLEAGDGLVELQECFSCVLRVDGPGEIRLRRATGTLTTECRGSGGIQVADGLVTHLMVIGEGSCDVEVGGTINAAELKLDGTADARLGVVKTAPRIVNQGIGEVTINQEVQPRTAAAPPAESSAQETGATAHGTPTSTDSPAAAAPSSQQSPDSSQTKPCPPTDQPYPEFED
ncbi:MAG: hypothetical protein HQL82_10355 [Magnetococcales bacterium]|nr:hypothetical protein [Magnetococcales bacterium]